LMAAAGCAPDGSGGGGGSGAGRSGGQQQQQQQRLCAGVASGGGGRSSGYRDRQARAREGRREIQARIGKVPAAAAPVVACCSHGICGVASGSLGLRLQHAPTSSH
jgi:hypothetical protein